MFKLFSKILLFFSAFCLLFAASSLMAFAQCEGVYFKTTTRKVLAEKVLLFNSQEYIKDLTGDGKLDVIGFARDDASNQYTKIYILPGNGAGDFDAPIQIPLPAPIDPFSQSFKIADFNSDGKNDFIVRLNTNPATVLVYQNNGNGTFTALTPYILPNNEGIENLVDINSDGRADLLTSRSTSPPGQFYRLANADGTFGASVQLNAAEYTFPVDFNSDSKVDFPVIAQSGANYYLQFYMNLGNGIFTLSSSSTLIDNVYSALVAVADFNNDGKPDFLFNSSFTYSGGQPRLVALINLGGGNFSRTELTFPYRYLLTYPAVEDFNGDGFPDVLVINGESGLGYTIFTNNGTGGFTSWLYTGRYLGTPVGDFDGDNKADAIQISNFDFQNNTAFLKVFDETQFAVVKNVCNRFGQTKIVDFDGDGLTDPTFWRASDSRWRYQQTNSPYNMITVNWGAPGDIPMPGDYDADGKTDIAVYRPSTGVWYVINSSNGSFFGVTFGASEDKPVASDYNGDGRTDFAVFRPSSGIWYVLYGGTFQFYAVHFGASEDRPVPEDYDGDGKTDFAVFRPSSGIWYVLRSSDLSFFGVPWGLNTDTLAPADYDGDGKADITVFRSGIWYIRRSNNFPAAGYAFGNASDVPQPSDWDGNGIWNAAVYRPNTKIWYTSYSNFITFGDTTGEVPISSLNKSY